MKTEHLTMQSSLFELVELIAKRKLTDREMSTLTDILSLTHNDGYHYGCRVTQDVYKELRNENV